MQVKCPDCGKVYDDARRWTICPHYDLDEHVNGDLCKGYEFSAHDEKARERVEKLLAILRDEEIEVHHSVDDNPVSFGKHVIEVRRKFLPRVLEIGAHVEGKIPLSPPASKKKTGHVRVQRDALLEYAWGIIANAHGGNWEDARPDWKEAAEKWREQYHVLLGLKLDMLAFADLRGPNVERCDEYFKSCADWTFSDWMMAMTGEQGELANLLKKIRRGDFTLEEKREEVAKEIADVAIYLDLLAAKLGIDLGKAVREKFNEVSDRRDCPIKL